MDNSSSDKVILDLCGGSGAWSLPYKEAGYDVRVLTLPDWDISYIRVERGSVSYCIWNSDGGVWSEKITEICKVKDIYGIFAAPPCTEFSIAKNGSKRNRDFAKGMQVVKDCMYIIWECRQYGEYGNLHFWALENPKGYLRQFLGRPHFTYEQWQYGGDKRKATDIWGYFHEPAPTVIHIPDGLKGHDLSHSKQWQKIEVPEAHKEYFLSIKNYDERRAALRAITPEGFAKAFFRANR
jgi:site-specific DNA-cytosine methylase